jgi:hypothetical protein
VPNLIGAFFPWSKGTRMTTGVPDLAMMVPSPRAAASTNSENFAFASARLSCLFGGYGGMLGLSAAAGRRRRGPDDYAAGAAGADVIGLGASSAVSIGLANLPAQVE